MIIKNAKIVVKGNETRIVDIRIENDKISKILDNIENVGNEKIIDAGNNLTIPGGIDVHVHLREPGYEYKETIKTGTMAAAKGGYTTILPMPNLNPHPDNVKAFEKYLNKIKQDAVVKVIPYSCITILSKGEELVDMEALNKIYGVRYFTDDGVGVDTEKIMKLAMIKAKEINGLIAAHTEDMSYRKLNSCVHDGENAKKNGWVGIPSETEFKQIERDLRLAEETGTKYHICHISAKESVELLRKSKDRGVDVSGEVTIHHLLLTEDDVKDTNAKMNPPLRTKEDRESLINGLLDGTIDFLANDHAPHSEEEKKQTMEKAPFGIVTIETAIPLFYTNFVKKGIITLEQFIEFTSLKPAKRFEIKGKGKIEEGYDADIVILSDDEEVINKEKFLSKGKNTPFDGYICQGFPKITICGGKIVWEK
ncbi:dihydroorotase [Helcococcus ovis]|uniref:dihydroorotase n=1 Tax=Helcococcus TaxID=31983 RepID=UPI0038B84298